MSQLHQGHRDRLRERFVKDGFESFEDHQVLELLLSERGETISRERISEQIGESGANKVDVYMCYLRRKFEAAVGAPLISTVRGRGYRLN